jgi:glycosyltransferase involved in cell wall biosynthesis
VRILYFLQSLVKGGAERLILDVCNELNQRSDIEYLVVGFSEENDYKQLSQDIPYVVCQAKVKLSVFRRNIIQIDALQKIITDFAPDIIHSNVYICELLTREKTFSNIGYFTHCHNNMPEFKAFGFKTLFRKSLITKYYEKLRIEKRYLKCNNQFIAISNDTLHYYKKNLHPKLRKNIHFLPNAIDFNKFYDADKKQIPENINLIMVGHMADYKNQIFLLDVLQRLRKVNIHANLTLLGDWQNNGAKIESKAEQMGLKPYVSMPGTVEDVEYRLKNQHIYVHSAYYEPFGLVMIEAMAAGLPVVCLDGGGNRDIIENGKNGFIIEKPDAELFAEKIMEMINNPLLYSEISHYAQEYARRYDIKKYVDSLLEMYKDFVKDSSLKNTGN